jgi:hypothetical protein
MMDAVALVLACVLLVVFFVCRFTGCILNSEGTAVPADEDPDHPLPPPPEYPGTISGEATLVAWWRLGESTGTTAVDQKPPAPNGTYTNPGATVTDNTPDSESHGAPGTFTLGQGGLLDGDPGSTSVFVDGGYVAVPFDAALNPPTSPGFSVEAWVRPDWPESESHYYRCVVASREDTGVGGVKSGFILYAAPDPAPGGTARWEAWVGNGTNWVRCPGERVGLNTTTHLVMTYDGAILRLYVDGQLSHSTEAPNPGSAVPAVYAPVTGSRELRIGAGASELTPPRYPFRGRIQDISVYNGPLSGTAVVTHYQAGNGI